MSDRGVPPKLVKAGYTEHRNKVRVRHLISGEDLTKMYQIVEADEVEGYILVDTGRMTDRHTHEIERIDAKIRIEWND